MFFDLGLPSDRESLFCPPDGDALGQVEPRDKVRANHRSGGGVVFANRAAGKLCHSLRQEESIAQQCEHQGDPYLDEAAVNHGSGSRVVFANIVVVDRPVEGVVLRCEEVQIRNELSVDGGSTGGVVFTNGEKVPPIFGRYSRTKSLLSNTVSPKVVFKPVIKLPLIAAPVVASYSPTA